MLQPASDRASKENLARTINPAVELASISSYLSAGEMASLSVLYPEGRVPLWGAKPGENNRNAKRWSRIAAGDYILFALGKNLAMVAQITDKLHNAALARHLWGETTTANGSAQTWEYMFSVRMVRDEFALSKAEFNKSISESRDPDAHIREFVVLKDVESAGVITYLGLDENPASPARARPKSADQGRRERRRRSVADFDRLDEAVQSLRRLEQQLLRKYLLPEDTGTCALCGRTFPISFLVAAHIKPRAACTDEEKLDFENVAMPNCKMGCDELYGRGLIAVDGSGSIQVSNAAPDVGPVGTYIKLFLAGKQSEAWLTKVESRKYFSFHMSHEFKAENQPNLLQEAV